jgi:Maintenance of mitochondrial morphology protein 1
MPPPGSTTDEYFAIPLLERVFHDMQDSDVFRQAITQTITKKIDTLPLPDFLGPVHLDRLVFGESFVKVHSVRTASTSQPHELISEIDMEYRGGAGADISTEIYINWPRSKAGTIALSITVRLIELSGKVCC